MKYSILQKKIICEKRKNLYELRDDQDFIDEEDKEKAPEGGGQYKQSNIKRIKQEKLGTFVS